MSDSLDYREPEEKQPKNRTEHPVLVPDLDLDLDLNLDSPGAAVEGWDRARLAEAIFEDGAPPLLFL